MHACVQVEPVYYEHLRATHPNYQDVLIFQVNIYTYIVSYDEAPVRTITTRVDYAVQMSSF